MTERIDTPDHADSEGVEKTDPTPEQQSREAAEAKRDSAYNDPLGGLPIA